MCAMWSYPRITDRKRSGNGCCKWIKQHLTYSHCFHKHFKTDSQINGRSWGCTKDEKFVKRLEKLVPQMCMLSNGPQQPPTAQTAPRIASHAGASCLAHAHTHLRHGSHHLQHGARPGVAATCGKHTPMLAMETADQKKPQSAPCLGLTSCYSK